MWWRNEEKKAVVVNWWCAFRKELAKLTVYVIGKSIRPLDLLKETIENQDWFKGLILSTTFLEMFGLIVLNSYFRQEKKGPEHQKIVTDFFDRFGLMKTIQLLYLCGLIGTGTYRKMKNIVKERNRWIHRVQQVKKKDFAYLVDVEQKDREKIMNLIADAINCLKELGVGD